MRINTCLTPQFIDEISYYIWRIYAFSTISQSYIKLYAVFFFFFFFFSLSLPYRYHFVHWNFLRFCINPGTKPLPHSEIRGTVVERRKKKLGTPKKNSGNFPSKTLAEKKKASLHTNHQLSSLHFLPYRPRIIPRRRQNSTSRRLLLALISLSFISLLSPFSLSWYYNTKMAESLQVRLNALLLTPAWMDAQKEDGSDNLLQLWADITVRIACAIMQRHSMACWVWFLPRCIMEKIRAYVDRSIPTNMILSIEWIYGFESRLLCVWSDERTKADVGDV